MTDTIKSLTVVLERDIREDDVQLTMSAISQIRNVLAVSSNPVTTDDYVNRQVIKRELTTKIYNALN
jgi:hypothetical protein